MSLDHYFPKTPKAAPKGAAFVVMREARLPGRLVAGYGFGGLDWLGGGDGV
jgi:hypothetical protein